MVSSTPQKGTHIVLEGRVHYGVAGGIISWCLLFTDVTRLRESEQVCSFEPQQARKLSHHDVHSSAQPGPGSVAGSDTRDLLLCMRWCKTLRACDFLHLTGLEESKFCAVNRSNLRKAPHVAILVDDACVSPALFFRLPVNQVSGYDVSAASSDDVIELSSWKTEGNGTSSPSDALRARRRGAPR